MSECGPEMMREHEQRITSTEASTKEAHGRINSLVDLIKDFTVEMRESNKNTAALVLEVRSLTEKMVFVAKATEKHEEDISSIKDNMETKDTVLKLYERIEEYGRDYKNGLEAIMTELRKQKEDLQEHKLEPAKEALANQQALKKWLLVGFGSILLSIATTAALIIAFGK